MKQSTMIREAVRIIEEALQADVTEVVGRGYYGRAAEGRIEYGVPQVRGVLGLAKRST